MIDVTIPELLSPDPINIPPALSFLITNISKVKKAGQSKYFCVNFIQVEGGKGFFTFHEGGSDRGKIFANMTGKKNEEEQISIPGNQMFVVFHTNEITAKVIYFARIEESM